MYHHYHILALNSTVKIGPSKTDAYLSYTTIFIPPWDLCNLYLTAALAQMKLHETFSNSPFVPNDFHPHHSPLSSLAHVNCLFQFKCHIICSHVCSGLPMDTYGFTDRVSPDT
jgi:hypothetical protein